MGKPIKLWELSVMALLVLACFAYMARALYEVTYLPMSENWRECHRITLCNSNR
jgi:hypothetical protein